MASHRWDFGLNNACCDGGFLCSSVRFASPRPAQPVRSGGRYIYHVYLGSTTRLPGLGWLSSGRLNTGFTAGPDSFAKPGERDQPHAIGGRQMNREEMFMQLMAVARETPETRRQLVTILSQEAFHRQSLLGTLLEDLRMRGAPVEFIECIGFLRDDDTAARALELLRG